MKQEEYYDYVIANENLRQLNTMKAAAQKKLDSFSNKDLSKLSQKQKLKDYIKKTEELIEIFGKRREEILRKNFNLPKDDPEA